MAVAGIKAIKLYAWEQPYTDRINALRAEELVEIRRTGARWWISTIKNNCNTTFFIVLL